MSSLRTFTCVGNLPDCRAQRVGEPYQPQTRKALLNQGWRWSVQVRWRCCWHGVSKYILSVLTKLERVRSVQLNTLLDKRIHAVHARLEEMIIYKGERGGVDISVICGCCLANHAVFFFPNICSRVVSLTDYDDYWLWWLLTMNVTPRILGKRCISFWHLEDHAKYFGKNERRVLQPNERRRERKRACQRCHQVWRILGPVLALDSHPNVYMFHP